MLIIQGNTEEENIISSAREERRCVLKISFTLEIPFTAHSQVVNQDYKVPSVGA